ncbi:AraC family transcriptional regulator [Streptomyces sp. NPDC021722]
MRYEEAPHRRFREHPAVPDAPSLVPAQPDVALPDPRLRGEVLCYQVFPCADGVPHSLTTDGRVRMILLAERGTERHPDVPPVLIDSLLSGLKTPTGDTLRDGEHGTGVEVALEPWAVFRLFGTSPEDLGAAINDRDRFPGSLVHAVARNVSGTRDWAARRAVIDAALVERQAANPPCPVPLRQAWRRLVETGGRIPITRLAADVAWSQNQLARRFREQIGLSPKVAARALRLRRALRLLATGQAAVRAAMDCGFCDPAHLSRECTALTGRPPSQLLAARSVFHQRTVRRR